MRHPVSVRLSRSANILIHPHTHNSCTHCQSLGGVRAFDSLRYQEEPHRPSHIPPPREALKKRQDHLRARTKHDHTEHTAIAPYFSSLRAQATPAEAVHRVRSVGERCLETFPAPTESIPKHHPPPPPPVFQRLQDASLAASAVARSAVKNPRGRLHLVAYALALSRLPPLLTVQSSLPSLSLLSSVTRLQATTQTPSSSSRKRCC